MTDSDEAFRRRAAEFLAARPLARVELGVVPASTPDESGWPPMLQGRFPYWMLVDVMEVPALVARLAWPSERMPNGSSLIIDADAPEGMRRIWLSEVSKRRLEVDGW